MRGSRFLMMLGLAGAACACVAAAPAKPGKAERARATIEARSGSTLSGTATFTAKAGGLEVVVNVSGAPPGQHAVHLHEKGDCSAPDAASAGGHFNPGGMPHGAPDAAQHHAGDFGNMTVGEDGKGTLTLHTTMLTVDDGANAVIGHAIIVHANADDMTTQPTGNAGGRIGCGVVSR